MRDPRTRLERLEQEAERQVEDGEGIPSMQAILQAIHASPQAGEYCELARRLLFPDTTARHAERIRQTLDDWTLEIVARLTDDQPIDDCHLDTSGLPPEWFARPAFGRLVGGEGWATAIA